MTVRLTATRARRLRARNQLIAGSSLTPTEVVDRAVALQGQNLGAVLRAIALRSAPGTTVADVRAAFDRGELVRSWPMRGTLFATTPQHLATLLQITGPRIHRATTRRRAELGLGDATIEKAWEVLGTALSERPLGRAEALDLWEAAGIATRGGPGYHLLMHLAVAGHIHWGPFAPDGTAQLLALSPAPKESDPEDALVEVVRGYVLARGPVTEADLAWWTKLPRGMLRRALSEVEDLVEVQMEGVPALVVVGDARTGGAWAGGARAGGTAYDAAPPEASATAGAAPTDPAEGLTDNPPSGVRLLPAFDEWVLGHADRSLIASPTMLQALVPGNNGVFRPAVLVDGRVVGTWGMRPPRAGRPATAEVDLVEDVPARTRLAVDRAAGAWSLG